MLRIIGDIHQIYNKYYDIIKNADQDDVATLQLGDMGFDYTFLRFGLDPDKHKFFKGNHDNYDEVDTYKEGYNLGDYGMANHGDIPFYFIRGGFSIDWKHRVVYDQAHGTKCWWSEEELSDKEMEKCLQEYSVIKPDVLLTHEGPRSITHHFCDSKLVEKFGYKTDTFTTKTSELMDRILKVYRPKLWVMGHYHVDFDKVLDGTRFKVLPILGTFDIT